MRAIYVIGIGAGDPEQITVQAVNSLNRLDVVFIVEKAGETEELSVFREGIHARYVADPDRCRIVRLADPARDRSATDYRSAVATWRGRRAQAWEKAIATELGDDERGGFLVWGDPTLYDSTIAVLDDVLARGRVVFDYEVVPGISSVQALAARHRIPLNRVGGAVQITTGRRLAAGLPADVDDVVVMLDASCTFTEVAEQDLTIYWGAYLGSDDEILVAGPVSEAGQRIERLRAEARQRKGWVMDTYLLRRGPD